VDRLPHLHRQPADLELRGRARVGVDVPGRPPDTLATRANIAAWTSECGDPARALRLSQELLPDQARVLGPHHPDTLATRANIAAWTSECGDPAGALRLSQELLPDLERVLGPHHPYTLATRANIAH